jgi:hypothetical protein
MFYHLHSTVRIRFDDDEFISPFKPMGNRNESWSKASDAYKKHKRQTAFIPHLEKLEDRHLMAGEILSTIDQASMDTAADIGMLTDSVIAQISQQERAQTSAEVQTINQQLPGLQQKQTDAQNVLNTWNNMSPYIKSGYNAANKLSSITNSTTKKQYQQAMPDHQKVVNGFLSQAQNILNLEAQNKMTDASNAQKSLQKNIDYYFNATSGRLTEYNMGRNFNKLSMPMPRYATDCKNEMARQKTVQTNLQNSATTATTTLQTAQNTKAVKEQQLNQGPLDLGRQSPTIDGNTSQEIAAWDKALEELMAKSLQGTVNLDLASPTADPRFARANGQMSGQMTTAESQKWMQEVARAVTENSKDVTALRGRMISLLQTSPVGDMLREGHKPEIDMKRVLELVDQALEEEKTLVKVSIEEENKNLPVLRRNLEEENMAMDNLMQRLAPARAEMDAMLKERTRLEGLVVHFTQKHETMVREGWHNTEIKACLNEKNRYTSELRIMNERIVDFQRTLTPLESEYTRINNRIDDFAIAIATVEERLKVHITGFAMAAQLQRKDYLAAAAEAAQLSVDAYNHGYETMPHVRPMVDIMDKDMGSGSGAYFLDTPIKEIRQHPGVVLGIAGGTLKITGRVTNNGDRGGPVTVRLYGLSDRMPDIHDERVLTIGLSPGESKDFIAYVNIPAGEKQTGWLVTKVTTPFEPDVMHETKLREAREMKFSKSEKEYKEGGEGAVVHNSRVIMQSPGGIGTAQERLGRYLAANPWEAAGIAARHAAGEYVAEADLIDAILTAMNGAPPAKGTTVVLQEMAANGTIDAAIISGAVNEMTIAGSRTTPEVLKLSAGLGVMRSFTLNEAKMVNFWVEPSAMPNVDDIKVGTPPDLSISLSGLAYVNGETKTVNYRSGKLGRAGESISTMLPPGRYMIAIDDSTNYRSLLLSPQEIASFAPLNVNLQMNIAPYRTQNIEGRISVKNSDKTMPVKMWVAEFANEQRLEQSDTSLNPEKPVWVVIHGMDSGDRTEQIEDLAKTLKKYPEMQVVTINWENAAKDGIFIRDALWTPAVGKWVARQLVNMGFKASHIYLGGWSHGSYVAYSVAEEVNEITKEKIGALVALDPAGNWPLLSDYDHTLIDFKKFANSSVAIEGSFAAGSNDLTATADISFHINSLNTSSNQIWKEHSGPIKTLSAILKHELLGSSQISDYLSLPNIMNPSLRKRDYQNNAYNGSFEFIIDITVEEKIDVNGTLSYAKLNAISFIGNDGLEKKIFLSF